ncbi:unnamed protein product [Didymodactylos carnosus]|uniref:Uncharacterized protein n=1 Tax=Didymodactylos carnosus TaxID=1234261 RepID=A0A814MYH9_9BILA|nr:unnamed protein product [Didymodactylos carnosus]CAF1268446.1 unnamed protein product [Didymodactylos carnosus]CAF3850435.1 unnamed protein product [Didymodactylos carnosus]CAF4074142.1 unnamed protein product [Didymodactylos carnosus]
MASSLSSTTFETLPDEILMIILRYSGNVYTIFRTFSGLNQRLNNILVDRHLHLFTDFLYMNIGDTSVDEYYNSVVFHDVSQQLSSLKTTKNDQQLRQCLQSLVTFHVKQMFNRSKDQLQSNIEQFQSIRKHLSDTEIDDLDKKLEKTFMGLNEYFQLSKNIKRIEFLVLVKGARLKCDDSDQVEFNFAKAVHRLLLANINSTQSVTHRFSNSLVRMFKILLISNPDLLKNREYNGYGAATLDYLLFYAIYHLQYIYAQSSHARINIQCYQAVVNFLLFVIQCLKHISIENFRIINSFSKILKMLMPAQLNPDQEIFIHTSQLEILKIMMNENILTETEEWDDDDSLLLQQVLIHLIKIERLEMILFIYHHSQHLFQNSWDNRRLVSDMTGNLKRRQLFHRLLDDKSFGMWLASTDLLFVLLQKKECKFVKKIIKLAPLLVHQFDKDDNDPLLYVCLKVRGCRHRLVEFLIKMGCNLQIRNSNNQNFIDALQLKRNKKLLENLIQRETIQIDHVSGEMAVALANRS